MRWGFTIIELLVAITIVGILMAGTMVYYTAQMANARDTTRQTDLNNLLTAVMQYRENTGEYPPDTANWEEVLLEGGYITEIPEDPKAGDGVPDSNGLVYDYWYELQSPSWFQISAKLENDTSDTTNSFAIATPLGVDVVGASGGSNGFDVPIKTRTGPNVQQYFVTITPIP